MWQSFAFAWTANVLVFIYKIPQISKLCNDKDTSGFSVLSYIIQSFSYSLYIAHGFVNNDDALAYGMIIPLLQNILVILIYLHVQKTSL